ncbi:unnamed protein product, partial [Ilex paraguariensis]
EAEVLVPTVSKISLKGAEVSISSAEVPAPVGIEAPVSPPKVLASVAPSTPAIISVPPELPKPPEAPIDSTSTTILEILKLPRQSEIPDPTIGT